MRPDGKYDVVPGIAPEESFPKTIFVTEGPFTLDLQTRHGECWPLSNLCPVFWAQLV